MQSPSAPAAPPPGALICGKYRLLRRIGEGAMGVVWAAHNEATSREVALKLLVRPDPELRVRLLREARACGAVSHRNIVDIYDAAEAENGDPFLVMPLLSGETLSSLLKRKRKLEIHDASRIARDIARGLSAAHERGIIHRDLKPSNIFLHTEPGEGDAIVKILDFGVSKFLAGPQQVKTATGILIGSPAYMSPEQVRAQSDIDTRADLWALGVVMFEMLTSRRPIQGKAHELLRNVLDGEIPAVSQLVWQIDPGLDALVTQCLQRDREKRPRSAAEVAAALEPFVTPPAPQRVPSRPGSSPELRHEIPQQLGRGSWGEAAPGRSPTPATGTPLPAAMAHLQAPQGHPPGRSPTPATGTPLPAAMAHLQAPQGHPNTPVSGPRGAVASPGQPAAGAWPGQPAAGAWPGQPAAGGAATPGHRERMASNPLGDRGTIKMSPEQAAAYRSTASASSASLARPAAPLGKALSLGGTVPLDPLPEPKRPPPAPARSPVVWIAMAVVAAALLLGIGMAAGYLLRRSEVERPRDPGGERATFRAALSFALGKATSPIAATRLDPPC
ncbi:Protein kinase [Sorangium cellulosum So ce56]|uniref:Protein kinase n=1 Tax=Sorangium cellulosum (strain So ce56) TaxID=448385 RepID=A9FDH1_SORC5|nr:serine/threonine-protein kinase [Sorangium cellulosum]CAN91761.1 Protein kinase [Sorangium cellulosum So ce56]